MHSFFWAFGKKSNWYGIEIELLKAGRKADEWGCEEICR